MPTADKIQKQVQELTATLAKTEAAEKAKKIRKEAEQRRKVEEKRKADEEEKEAVEKLAKASKRKVSRFIVLNLETEEISEVTRTPTPRNHAQRA